MRSTNAPPTWRAWSQLNSAVRALPMWRSPVGAGGNRSRSLLMTSRPEQVLRDHDPLNLVRALVDLRDLGVAHEPLGRRVLRVAEAAEQLHAVGRDPHRGVG